MERDAEAAQRFAGLALDCVHKEYPGKIAHVLNSDQDVLPPRRLTPAFFGCYDWHSSVHAHWLLARLTRTIRNAPFAASRTPRCAQPDGGEPRCGSRLPRRPRAATPSNGLTGLRGFSTRRRAADWDDAQARGWSAAMEPVKLRPWRDFEKLAAEAADPIR